jgi:hypothetical protein
MSRVAVALLLLAFAVAGLALTARAQQDPAPQDGLQADQELPEQERPRSERPHETPPSVACPPDRLLVKVGAGADAAAVVARHGGTVIQTIPGVDVQVVIVPAGTGQQALDALNADPEVEYAEPDGVVRVSQPGPGTSCASHGRQS